MSNEQGMLLRCVSSQGHLLRPSLSALWNKGCSQKMCFYATGVDQEAQWSHQTYNTKSNDIALHNGHFQVQDTTAACHAAHDTEQ